MRRIVLLCCLAFGPACVLPVVTIDKYLDLRKEHEVTVESANELYQTCKGVYASYTECMQVLERCVNSCSCDEESAPVVPDAKKL